MKKIPALVFSIIFGLILSLSFFAGRILAVTPIPAPGRIPCKADQTENPNFSSDRPYQASPCGDSPKAVWCGNSLKVEVDTPSKTYDGIVDSISGNPLFTLFGTVGQTFAFNLSGAQFPIEGNTELTKNSQSATESIDDPTKVNEYVSWYLGGVNNRAESGDSKNTADTIVNFSGPVQKLLPSIIQDAQRIAIIKSPSQQETFTDETKTPSGSSPNEAALVTEGKNHNQIVVCANGSQHIIPSWLTNILGLPTIGAETPTECYPNAPSKAQGDLVLRLSDWEGSSPTQDLINKAGQFLSKIVPSNILTELIGGTVTRWSQKTPPLPWDDGTGKPFKTSDDYQKAYNEWRGELCAYVPVPFAGAKKLVCVGAHPILTNPYADLYQFIPLSNTVDKNAKNLIKAVPIQGEAGTEIKKIDTQYKIIKEPVLYFPHTQENSDLSTLLNKTYAPKSGTQGALADQSTEVNDITQCRTINVRSNPGDYLFPEVQPSEVNVFVFPVAVTKVPCHQVTKVCSNYLDQIRAQALGEPVICAPTTQSVCQGKVSIEIQMETKTPYADELWQSTVAGAGSTFRRIYPKVDAKAPVSCIADIPTVTNVTYTPTQGVANGQFKVIGPGGNNTTDNPQLYFPHIGGIYEYFLKGIQTALRPLGLGDPSPESGPYCAPTEPSQCKVDIPDSAVPSKYLGLFKANFIDLANRWSTSCPGPELNLAAKCYNYVVTEAQKAKINPAFALTIWLNESGASNYCASGKTAQDFGINIPALYQNMVGQLTEFLKLPDRFSSCRSTPGWIEPMEAFLSRFQSSAGVCDPKDTTAAGYYADVRDNTWQFVTGTKCIKNGKFAITWPTDLSCP